MDNSVIKTNISASSDSIKMQERLAIFLALIAGYIDATGLIQWKTYVSFMSGNTTSLGAAISTGKFGIIIASAIVISCFLLGIYAGTCLSLWKKINNQILTFYIVSGILIFYSIIAYFYDINNLSSIAIVGFSMGMMNTIITSVGNQKVNTDFVTGTLNSLARNTAMLTMTDDKIKKKEYTSNAIHLLLLWIGFLSGAFIAPFLLDYFGKWTLMIPALLLMICGILISKNNTKTNIMLQKNDVAPDFTLYATPDQKITLSEFKGKNVILAFYPADWSPVCSDQMALYNETLKFFKKYDAEIFGISVDSKWCHLAFSQSRNLHFPLLADFEAKGEIAKQYGVYDDKEGECKRALFVINKEGIIEWSYLSPTAINPGADGILDALETLNTK